MTGYCLGISDVCPVHFGLYFRHFLNQERMALNKLSDIDIDFPHDRKDDVVDLIFAKYGRETTRAAASALDCGAGSLGTELSVA